MEENKLEIEKLTDEDLKYVLEEMELELQRMYIDYDLSTRRLQRAEAEIEGYRKENEKRTKPNQIATEHKYRK